MIKIRGAEPGNFILVEFDTGSGTQGWQAVQTIYSSLNSQIHPDSSNDTVNGIIDPVKDDLQNKINSALDDTYVAPDIPEPVSKVDLSTKDPADYPALQDFYVAAFKAFRDAHNGKSALSHAAEHS